LGVLKYLSKKGKLTKAFMLIELLIAAGITAAVLVLVTFVFVNTNEIFEVGKDALQAEGDLRLAMDWLTKDIRGANDISPGTITTLTISTSGSDATVEYRTVSSSGKSELRRKEGGKERTIAYVSMQTPIVSDRTVKIVLSSSLDSSYMLSSEISMRNK